MIDLAYQKASEVMRECIDPIGLKASAKMTDYHQVWARDSMITLLGAVFLKEAKDAIQKSLETLAIHQNELGCIPNFVDVKNYKPNFRSYADGCSWFVIGHYVFYKRYQDFDFLKDNFFYIKKALLFLRYQDSDNCGLIELQEAADWEDLFAIRGKGLYVNVLYSMALKCGAKIAKLCKDKYFTELYNQKSQDVKKKIRDFMWVDSQCFKKTKKDMGEEEKIHLNRVLGLRKRAYFLPYLTYRDNGEWFDSFGNLLAIIFGVADESQTKTILDYISQVGAANPYPIKAIYPPVRPGEKDWREYYRSNNLNLPDQYHNGGIWPFLGGFYIAALVKAKRFKEAEENLAKLAQINKKGKETEWEFNEWLHGITGNPMGMVRQAWSAGMYIYAYRSLKKQNLIFFD